KAKGLTCSKASGRTIAVTGMVTFPPALSRINSPTNVPATSPWPGRFCFRSETEIVDGAAPELREALSQLPPSAVFLSKVHAKDPVPPSRTCIHWAGGLTPPVASEKLIWPGRLSKKADAGFAIVSVTGTVMLCDPSRAVNTTCPVYIPAANDGLGWALTRRVC